MRPTSSGRWRRGIGAIALAFGVVVTSGCMDEAVNPLEPDLHRTGKFRGGSRGWDLPLLSAAQLARSFHGRPCMRGVKLGGRHASVRQPHGEPNNPYRDFDFWVGEWNVTNVNGILIGTNIVTSELDGCLVQEHWTASNGSRGLSLNAYDRETELWYQTWSSQVPQTVFGRLRTSGGFADDTMTLTGTRDAAAGFTFQDTWTWSENEQGQVIQTALAAVPELDFSAPFTGIYTRGDDVTPAPPQVSNWCDAGQDGEEQRRGDFLVGTWKVRAEHGPFLGESVIESELSDCLLVERFESRGGLRAISFTYVDLWVERWYRTYVDSEGERMELDGGFEDGVLVLRGTEPTRSGPVDVTIRWEPDGTGFRQVWEVSRDGGQTWHETASLRYMSRES